VLEEEGERREREPGGDELDHRAGAQVERATVALLVKRAGGDRHEREHRHREAEAPEPADRQALRDDQRHAAEAEREPDPLARGHALAEERCRGERGEDRLQADDQRREPGRHAGVDRGEDPAQVAAVQQHAGDRDVDHLRAGRRPARPEEERDREHQRDDQGEPVEEEGHRLGVRQAVLGADEPGRPEEDEGRRHPADPPGPAGRRARGHRRPPAAIPCLSTFFVRHVNSMMRRTSFS
jgi:hypothetical protein